jgi:acetate kinase
MSRILVLNAGSSSLKYEVVDLAAPDQRVGGIVERIGEQGSGVPDHAAAARTVLDSLGDARPDAVGHRIVHGGTRFVEPTLIDDDVEAGIEALIDLAPLHNPPGLAGIRAARAVLPDVPHVAVFDTAFHATLPDHAATYAIDPVVAAEAGIRRYGFHGTSFAFVSRAAAQFLGRPLEQLRLIVLHLGNGASACAISAGVSIDTTMGLTPLEGLVMGTRSGDLDPGVLLHLARLGRSVDEIDDLLNRRSGLLGMAGSNDLRDVTAAAEAGDAAATLAIEVMLHRLRKYLGAYAAELGGVDAVVFTAGIGENAGWLRARAVERLGFLGVFVDPARNDATAGPRRISFDGAEVEVLVVPTDEELEIAEQSASLTGWARVAQSR